MMNPYTSDLERLFRHTALVLGKTLFLLVHIIMSYTYAIDMVSDIYLNLFGTISNINGD